MRGRDSAAIHDYGDRHHKAPEKRCYPHRGRSCAAPSLFYARSAAIEMEMPLSSVDCREPKRTRRAPLPPVSGNSRERIGPCRWIQNFGFMAFFFASW